MIKPTIFASQVSLVYFAESSVCGNSAPASEAIEDDFCAARARLRLLLHQLFKFFVIDIQIPLACHKLRQVEREAVGVIKLERIVAADNCIACFFGAGGGRGENLNASVERSAESWPPRPQ